MDEATRKQDSERTMDEQLKVFYDQRAKLWHQFHDAMTSELSAIEDWLTRNPEHVAQDDVKNFVKLCRYISQDNYTYQDYIDNKADLTKGLLEDVKTVKTALQQPTPDNINKLLERGEKPRLGINRDTSAKMCAYFALISVGLLIAGCIAMAANAAISVVHGLMCSALASYIAGPLTSICMQTSGKSMDLQAAHNRMFGVAKKLNKVHQQEERALHPAVVAR